MKNSLIISAIAAVFAFTTLASSDADPSSIHSKPFTTAPIPPTRPGRPDDFSANGGGTTITQSTVEAINGSFSLGYSNT